MTKLTHDQINQMTLEQFRALLLDPLATTSAAGLVEMATDAETQTGTDTTRSVTPASLKSAVPFKTVAAMDLFVNSGAAYGSYGAGSDSNAGTQAAPFATIAAAIAKIPKFLEYAVKINLAGEPHYYEWKPDGTNGIKFTTGDSGVTVAVVAGSSLSVAISGSAVTITLATGGSTIAQIITAINNSATVGAVIYPIAVGTTSTNITATLSAQSLTGGNVRTYAESVVLNGIVGGSKLGKWPWSTASLTLTGAGGNQAGVLISKDFAADAIASAESAYTMLSYLTVRHTGAALAKSGIVLANVVSKMVNVRIVGAWGNDSNSGALLVYGGAVFSYRVFVYNAIRAVYTLHGGVASFEELYGGGNTTGLVTYGGQIFKNGTNLTGFATTAESGTPAGTIL